jgi:glutamine amidotransferase-like uncharacterized protein
MQRFDVFLNNDNVKYMKTLLIVLTLLASPFAWGAKPLALVYIGPGSCFVCWTSAAVTAKKFGFQVKLVDGKHTSPKTFNRARLWIQPGGKSRVAAKYMGEKTLEKIRNFVANGGGYTGFCAGGFLSTAMIGTSDIKGLGILSGTTKLHDQRDGPGEIIKIHWEGTQRSVLYHGGPHFNLSGVTDPNLRVVASYDEDFGEATRVSAVTTTYGKGRVAVNGFHAEATKFWKFKNGLDDPDGQDQDLAGSFMRWAAGL